MIKVNHLEKYFNRRKRNEIHVINDISLEFPEKGLVVLLGASGSGKTTLLNVLGGLDKVQSGDIQFNQHALSGYKASTWDRIRNESVGYIFQNYNLLPELSVFDNIAFVLKMIGISDPAIIEERVNYILHAVKMYPFRKKKGLQLSGGQQQRVAIARALVKNPQVIIADEPTGNLDSKNTLDIMNIIKSISMEKLVVLVTHERDLAKFYGDRIIELKDGSIIEDYLNDESEDHGMSRDDTIYLKDLKNPSNLSDEKLNLSLFSDQDHEEPISIRLIIKNKTLYLDVDTNIKKIKFADESSGVRIKDESYIKKTRQQLIETTFDTNVLDNTEVPKQKKYMVSIKQTLMMAFQKIMRTSRKGKLMLFSFLVAGAVIAFTISTLAAVIIIRPEPYMQQNRGYVSVLQSNLNTMPTYENLLGLQDIDDENFYINTFSSKSLMFINPDGSSSMVGIQGNIDLIDHIKSNQLIAGRMPISGHEIVVSLAVADQLIDNTNGQDFGIWSYDHLFSETIRFRFLEIKVVGVVDTDISLIFMSRDLANFIHPITAHYFEGLPHSFLDDEDIIAGARPEEGQVLISSTMYETIFGTGEPYGEFPKDVLLFDYDISGVYEADLVNDYAFLTVEEMEQIRYENAFRTFIYTEKTAKMIGLIDGMGFTAYDIYDEAVKNARESQQLILISTISTSALLIGFAALGFYFVIRSSLISRIYEVSVYRALGVRKKDIFRSFIVEIFVLTTISTMVGYILATMALSRLQEGLLGEFNFFYVSPLTVVAGIIIAYIINILAGLLPVFLLL
ncbi:MAG: ABC transporter ATP-binding protein/permease, partial [Acholeplasmataceae bacterium]|nr:ABC transporter ATP-binding protein/permease [Acholeplasmataceae bacterium]